MSYATYTIQNWNAVLKGKSIQPQIALYITPDENFYAIAALHNGRVPIKVIDSGVGTYDNHLSYAQVQASSVTGGYRPNFQMDTKLVCLIPEVKWEGYPLQNGKVQILYYPEQLEQYQQHHSVVRKRRRQVVQKCNGLMYLLAMVMIILVLTKLIYK